MSRPRSTMNGGRGSSYVPRRSVSESRVVEVWATWAEAVARLRQIKEAGFDGMVTSDEKDQIVVIISSRKGLPLDRIPGRKA